MIEKEKKWILKEEDFNSLTTEKPKYKILQYYVNNVRYRFQYDIENSIETWIKCKKVKINDTEKIEEEERILTSDLPPFIFSETKILAKYRWVLNNDPELVIDKIIDIDSIIYPYPNIKYLLEVEEKMTFIKNLDDWILDRFPYMELLDSTNTKYSSNMNLAGYSSYNLDTLIYMLKNNF